MKDWSTLTEIVRRTLRLWHQQILPKKKVVQKMIWTSGLSKTSYYGIAHERQKVVKPLLQKIYLYLQAVETFAIHRLLKLFLSG